MAFREVIEAVLRAKDAGRFTAAIEGAAKAVDHLGDMSEQTAAQTELLETISDKLENQAYETAAAITLLAERVDELGDEYAEAAAKAAVANTVMKKSGSNAIFLGKSWAFWKDRLSLTRAEIFTTAITISSYLSPAVVALGASFATAALGGAGVAAGGLSSFLFGLGMLKTIVGPTFDGIEKIRKAQEQYNVTVQQYGAASLQASRANARLFAIIQENGGREAERAMLNLERFKDTWSELTAPGRSSILGILNEALGAGRTLMPEAAGITNSMAASVRSGFTDVLNDLVKGGEISSVMQSLGDTFNQAIGPGMRGGGNILVLIFRLIKASAPYVVRWAKAWERATAQWRDKATQSRVNSFLADAVQHFIAWWGLAKAVGRVMRTLWSSIKDQGLRDVIILTNLVNKFDEWLRMMRDTGQITKFFNQWNRSVEDAVWALQHPVEAVNRWLPQVMDAIAHAMVSHAPMILETFIQAFLDAGGWAQFLTTTYLLTKFGAFGALGKVVGRNFVKPFVAEFIKYFAAALIGTSTAEGALAGTMKSAGEKSGRVFGRAFAIGAIAGVALAATQVSKAGHEKGTAKDASFGDKLMGALMGGGAVEIWNQAKKFSTGDLLRAVLGPSQWKEPMWGPKGGSLGGVIPSGESALVGERGIELATATPTGTSIQPLSRNGRTVSPILDVPDMSKRFRFQIFTSVQVERREIARAVTEQEAYDNARRGGQ